MKTELYGLGAEFIIFLKLQAVFVCHPSLYVCEYLSILV